MNRDKIQILMVIGIYLAIALMLIAIIVLVKNSKEIKTDPIMYGIEKANFNSCTCYDDVQMYHFKSYELQKKERELGEKDFTIP